MTFPRTDKEIEDELRALPMERLLSLWRDAAEPLDKSQLIARRLCLGAVHRTDADELRRVADALIPAVDAIHLGGEAIVPIAHNDADRVPSMSVGEGLSGA